MPELEVRPSPVAGRGLFAVTAIEAGVQVARPDAPVHEAGPVSYTHLTLPTILRV